MWIIYQDASHILNMVFVRFSFCGALLILWSSVLSCPSIKMAYADRRRRPSRTNMLVPRRLGQSWTCLLLRQIFGKGLEGKLWASSTQFSWKTYGLSNSASEISWSLPVWNHLDPSTRVVCPQKSQLKKPKCISRRPSTGSKWGEPPFRTTGPWKLEKRQRAPRWKPKGGQGRYTGRTRTLY